MDGDRLMLRFLGRIFLPNGTAALPSGSFETEGSTGIYRISAGVWGVSILGNERFRVSEFGVSVPDEGTYGFLGTFSRISNVGDHVVVTTGLFDEVARFRPTSATTTVVFPGHSTSGNAANVFMANNGNIFRSTSVMADKTEVEDVDAGEAARLIKALRPVTYKRKGHESGPGFFGQIAEEVNDVDPRLATLDYDTDEAQARRFTYAMLNLLGLPYEPLPEPELTPIHYDSPGMIALLIKHAQSLEERVAELEARLGDA
jgi:hypothetical protein